MLYKGVTKFTAGRDLILMSGTIGSKPDDLYAYIKLTTPDTYRTHQSFRNTHVAKYNIFKQPTEWCNLELLQANLDQRRVYRTKEEVHKALPKARFIVIHYDLPKAHMALYKKLMEEQLLLLDDGSKIDATTAQRLYHAAQQIISNWGFYAGDPSKRSTVFDLIDNVMEEMALGDKGSSKLILWTIYQKTSGAVVDYVNSRLVKPAYAVAAYGLTNSKKSVAAFMDDLDAAALVAQPGSAGAGLNPQHLCWICAFVEVPTTTIPFKQSFGRIDRKGQLYPPVGYLFIARGTIQEHLLEKLFANDDLIMQAAGGVKSLKELIFPLGK